MINYFYDKMSSTYKIQNITYSGNLSRPSTTKGSILANNGTDNFELVVPGSNSQVLTSNSSVSAGVEWQSTSQNAGLAFWDVDPIRAIDAGATRYFLVDESPINPAPLVVPDSVAFYMSVNARDPVNGWLSNPTRFNGGTMTFTLGYTPANTNNIVANWIAYAGGPHLSIAHTDINTVANQFRTFTTTLNIAITSGQQLSVAYRSTFTLSGGPAVTYGNLGTLLLCRGT